MTLEFTSIPVAFFAGMIGVLSPCVWPLVPIVVSSAVAGSRWGSLSLASGLSASFAVAGTFLTFLLVSTGTDPEFFRYIAAALLVATGILLIVRRLADRVAMTLSRLTSRVAPRGSSSGAGAAAQFGVGALLGVVWLPCVGPTVGVAIALASLGENLLGSFAVMLAYGLGTGGVLLVVGLLSEKILAERKALGARIGVLGKKVLGWSVLLLGVLVLTRVDKILETWAIDLLPAWVYTM